MVLKTLYVAIDVWRPEEPPVISTEQRYDFLKSSRHVCNYVERTCLRPLKFNAVGFNRIVVSLKPNPSDTPLLNPCKVAVVDLPLRYEEYLSLSGANRSDFFIQLIHVGLEKLEPFHPIPRGKILESLAEFRAGGYRNEWVHLDKKFPKLGLRVQLNCRLDMSKFQLFLRAGSRDTSEPTELLVLETDPDEIAFGYNLGKIEIEGEELVLRDTLGNTFFTIELSKLL